MVHRPFELSPRFLIGKHLITFKYTAPAVWSNCLVHVNKDNHSHCDKTQRCFDVRSPDNTRQQLTLNQRMGHKVVKDVCVP